MQAKREGPNQYEQAFEDRLRDEGVRFARVDQTHRCLLGKDEVKTFDYLIFPRGGGRVLVELKGRLFRGDSLAGRRKLQCWVQREDVEALGQWQRRFEQERPGAEAIFVFAYQIEKIAIDEDGLAVYDVAGQRYVFLAIRLEDYRRCMKRRSVRWKTVTLSAEDFRSLCFPAERIWLGLRNKNEYGNTNVGGDDPKRRGTDR